MKKIVITAGGTSEKIDNVRKITNSSSGKLGMTIANHLLKENDDSIISIIKDLSPQKYLVGFKLLDGVSKEELISVAKKLRDKNKCDLVVANDLATIRNGEHIAYIIDKNNEIEESHGKDAIAKKLVRRMKNGK